MNGALEDRVAAAVDALADELVATLGAAVRIASVTPTYPGQSFDDLVGGEGTVSRLLAELYRRAGAEVDVFGLVPGRENAVGVVRGSGGGRSLIFNGHVDVVPPGPADEWRGGDPWSGAHADGRVWGRGTCDMKGGLVAQAFAAIALREAGIALRGDLLLEAVVGEEMMEHELGTSACIARGYRADAAVVAEPSGPPGALGVVPVTSGVMSMAVHVAGKATHPSMRGETITPGGYGPAAGVSAVDKAFVVYEALRQLEREWGFSKTHPLFRPGHFSLAPCVIVGGPRSGLVPFFIPDEARIEYEVWYSPDDDPAQVRDEVERHVATAAQLDPWLREHPPRVDWLHHWPASAIPVDHPLVACAADAHARTTGTPAVIHGHVAVQDMTWLTQQGIPAIGYGPGDVRIAHAVDEHVAVSELLDAARTYALLAAGWCGVQAPPLPPNEPGAPPS